MPSLDKLPRESAPDPRFPPPAGYAAPVPGPGFGAPGALPAGAALAERNWVLICYIIHVVGPFTGMLLPIVGVVMNHVFFGQSRTVFARSHHRWMLRTFWFWVLWFIVALVILFVGLTGSFVVPGRAGALLLGNLTMAGLIVGATILWWWYRTILGLVRFSRNQAMYAAGAVVGP